VSAAAHIHQADRRDPVEFAAIYAEYRRSVLRYLQAALRDQAEAEDAMHEVFLKAWRTLPSYDSPAGLRGWLFTVARTTALDHARRRSRQAPLAPQRIVSLVEEQAAAPRPASGHWISEPEVREAFGRLPLRQQEVIVLRYVMGCSHGESAQLLGCSEAVARKTHQRALNVLAAALAASDLAATRRCGERTRTRYAMGQLRLPRRIALGGFSLLPRLSALAR
jgi:RNA polymerase sigma-70 factor (ECF subfamily)